jgi:hypothetical protein
MNRAVLTSAVLASGMAGVALLPAVGSPTDEPHRVAAQAAVAPTPVQLTRAWDVAGLGAGASRALQQAAARKAAQSEQARRQAIAKDRRDRALRRASRARRASQTAPVSYGSPRAIARSMLAERGWSDEFGCLDRLWQRESGWRVRASNRSGAYGIPQALPGSKMASAGADWRSNPATQIRWGLGYIGSRYGGPCAAESHSHSSGWY